MAHYARVAASYINKLEAKLRAYEEVSESMGDCALSKFLAEEVEKEVAANDTPDLPDAWTADECEEWDKWQAEKASKEGVWDDWAEEADGEWEEDAQPPSQHLRAAAACPPNPASSACAVPPKMNSLTYRAEYMKLASRLC